MRLVIKKLKIADRNKILLDIPELMVNFSSLALMGPSGSGKSTLIKAIVKDNDIDLNQTGKIQLYGKSPQLRLGKEIRVIPQSPQNALDPFRKIRYQILETFKITEISKNYSLADFAKLCGISEKTFDLYPMQLSGGQAQRIICGLALIGKPQIIIADEPTSALDIEGRESFIELMNYALKKNTSLLLATHDLRVAKKLCLKSIELSSGQVEENKLIASNGDIFCQADKSSEKTIEKSKKVIVVKKLVKKFYQHKFFHSTTTNLFENVNFTIKQGDNVGIIGKNGTGKTTLIYILLGLIKPSGGSIEVTDKLDIVFQNSRTAVDPRYTVAQVLREANPTISENELTVILEKVGLEGVNLKQRALNLSGGQLQRICIARSILQKAKVICFDEAFSGLDNINKRIIWNLLLRLKKEYGLTYLFITHDQDLINKMDFILELTNQTVVAKKPN